MAVCARVWARLNLYGPLVALGVGAGGGRLRHTAVGQLWLETLPYLAAAAGRKGRVVGVDRSPAMLAGARERAMSPPVELVEGDATSLPFEAGTFDGAISTYGLTAVADVEAALDEMVRVSKPGGRVAVADVHFVNWPAPAVFNRAVTAGLRPFNTWYTDRDFPALLAKRGLRVASVATHRAALSLTVGERR